MKFGTKVIEVATFRRQVAAGEEVVADGVPAPDPTTADGKALVHHDNTFGTPEEDAFRRDFTINALFYDIATFSIIDYVGGLEDLSARVVRSIGDPETRIKEDPVRMLRAVALASRLDFTIDPPLADGHPRASPRDRAKLAAAPDRGVLQDSARRRSGADVPERSWRSACSSRSRPSSTSGPGTNCGNRWPSLDDYRRRFASTPETLTNPIVLGTLIVPLGIPLTGEHVPQADGKVPKRPPGLKLGELPLARNDVERLRQILSLQRRLHEVGANPRAKRALDPPEHLSRGAGVAGRARRLARDRRALERAVAEGPGEPADATAAAATAAAEDGPRGPEAPEAAAAKAPQFSARAVTSL